MKTPALRPLAFSEARIDTFGGIDRTPSAAGGAFERMTNMGADAYPALSPRAPRQRLYAPGGTPRGLCGGDCLCEARGGALYVDGEMRAALTDSEKTMARMGEQLIVFPDKVIHHLDTGVTEPMENAFECPADTAAARCDLTGTPAATGTFACVAAPGIGTGFQADDAVTVTGAGDMDGERVIYTVGDGFIVLGADPGESGQRMAGAVISRRVPDMDFIFEMDNRVFGCSGVRGEICASRLGDAKNFSAFLGVASDSYAVSTGAGGAFTGACAFMGFALFFTEDAIYKLYGTRPSNYELTRTDAPGVRAGCARSLCAVDGTLYYLSRGGVMAYDGGLPACVSRALGDADLRDAAAGCERGRYYLSAALPDGTRNLYVYDPALSLWHTEDDARAFAFARVNGRGVMARGDGVWYLRGGEETVSWSAESVWLLPPGSRRVWLGKMTLLADMPSGSRMQVELKYDGDEAWRPMYLLTAPWDGEMTLPLVLRRAYRVRVRLCGQGNVRVRLIAIRCAAASAANAASPRACDQGGSE